MKLLRKLWCLLRHRRVAAFSRWTLRADGTFQRHCARCEYGWSYPGTSKRYSGPIELVNGRWEPLRVST